MFICALLMNVMMAATPVQTPNNCVNPGGSCNGTVVCCDSYNNACVRGRCQRVP